MQLKTANDHRGFIIALRERGEVWLTVPTVWGLVRARFVLADKLLRDVADWGSPAAWPEMPFGSVHRQLGLIIGRGGRVLPVFHEVGSRRVTHAEHSGSPFRVRRILAVAVELRRRSRRVDASDRR